MKNLYEQTDRSLKRLKQIIAREYRKLISLAFDEISSITAPRIAERTYDYLIKEDKKEYRKIADDAIEYALAFLEELQETYGGTDYFFDKVAVQAQVNPEEMVDKVLKEYNPVTGYVFEREAERKEARMSEGMIASKEANDREMYRELLKTNTNLWFTQTKQYADDIADQTAIEVWKKAGIKKVMWVTARDERVCSKCGPLDGKIFDIDKVPNKPHYNCRCIKRPIITP